MPSPPRLSGIGFRRENVRGHDAEAGPEPEDTAGGFALTPVTQPAWRGGAGFNEGAQRFGLSAREWAVEAQVEGGAMEGGLGFLVGFGAREMDGVETAPTQGHGPSAGEEDVERARGGPAQKQFVKTRGPGQVEALGQFSDAGGEQLSVMVAVHGQSQRERQECGAGQFPAAAMGGGAPAAEGPVVEMRAADVAGEIARGLARELAALAVVERVPEAK